MRASEKAYLRLQSEIVEGQLKPGTVLAEVEQSLRIGVSRTPLREALSRLSSEGLVVAQLGRGAVVSQISLTDITELYELREHLEALAAALAAKRCDVKVFKNLAKEFMRAPELIDSGSEGIRLYYELNEKFDAAIDDSVRNSYLVVSLRNVRIHLSRVRRLARHNPDRLIESFKETLLIIEAIIAGNPSLASHASHVHLHKSFAHIKLAIRDQSLNGKEDLQVKNEGTDNSYPIYAVSLS